jgi:c-di-GMP-related signal transduction protein
VIFFAERVEDESVFNFLKQFDLISGYQGYYFEKPKHLFEGRPGENSARFEEGGTLAINFDASSIKAEKAEKRIHSTVHSEINLNYPK